MNTSFNMQYSLFTLFILVVLTACNADNSGNKLPGLDTDAPKVLTTVPKSDATNVRVGANISVNFDEEINVPRLLDIEIRAYLSSTIIGDSRISLQALNGVEFNTSKNSLIINPSEPFVLNTKYNVTLYNIEDKTGNVLPRYSWDFTVKSNVQLDIIPSNNSTNVPLNSVISIVFNQEMDPVSLDDGFSLSQASVVIDRNSWRFNYDTQNSTATYTLSTAFNANQKYTARLTGASTIAGVIAKNISSTFTVGTTEQAPNAKPNKPQNVIATAFNQRIELNWNAAIENTAQNYKVYVNIDNTVFTNTPIATVTGLRFSHTPVINGKKYIYTVRSVNADSIQSLPAISNEVVPVSVPSPTAIIATAGADNATVSWATIPKTSYNIYLKTVANEFILTKSIDQNEILKNPFAYTQNNLLNGTQYQFEVTAVDSQLQESPRGQSFSAIVTPGLAVQIPGPLTLSVSADVKQLKFNWTRSTNAEKYTLYSFNNLSADNYPVSAETTALFELPLNISVHKFKWLTAQYFVRACNSTGCTDSAAILATDVMINSIGYFKASNTDASDLFGQSVALSGDGNTLVIGAYTEGSLATGINGSQGNDSNISGEPSYAGAVYIYSRNANKSWNPTPVYIKASNTGVSDLFGSSLAVSFDGNTVAVAANQESDNSEIIVAGSDKTVAASNNFANLAGAVYVYTRDKTSLEWRQQAYIKPKNISAGDNFGHKISLSADGNTLAVASLYEDSNATGVNPAVTGDFVDVISNNPLDAGAVYIFIREPSVLLNTPVWTQQAYIKASNTDYLDLFGISLSLSADGNTLAVGAGGESSNIVGIIQGNTTANQNDNSVVDSGAVYVFTRNLLSNPIPWTQTAFIKNSIALSGNYFSQVSLSGDGNNLVVGSSLTGKVSVFKRNQTSLVPWSRTFTIQAPAGYSELGDGFAGQVLISNDGSHIFVSAINETSASIGVGADPFDHSSTGVGAVYVFIQGYSGHLPLWSFAQYVKASNSDMSDSFGSSFASDDNGSTLAVGAFLESSAAVNIGGDQSDNSLFQSGAVYLY